MWDSRFGCVLLISILVCSHATGQTAGQTTGQNAKADWARFRGPSGVGIAAASSIPTDWGRDAGVLWKTALPGAGASSPIVFGDRVYLTAYTGYLVPGEETGSLEKLKRHVIAIRLTDGQLIWDKSFPAKLPEEERIRDHGFAANSVAVDSERVYAFFGKSGVLALDHEGNQLWQADVGAKTNGWGTAASPVLYKDRVFINASVESESLIALNAKTGAELWRASGIREAWNTPLVVQNQAAADELVIATQGSIQAFNPQTGKSLWSCETDIGWYMVPSVVADNGILYCLGGRSGTASLAVRVGGQGDVTQTHRLWTSPKGSNVSSPVFKDGYLYWVNDSRETAYCADAKTGKVIFEQRLPRGGQFYASALLVDEKLLYVNRQGKTFVLAAKPEYELLSVNDLSDGSDFNGSPAVTGNQLLLRSDKYLYCIGSKK
ncbi:MAG: PQQ-binding-like beta-propeller repeat protein [Pirellulaceae bacterium]|nr:PQQ-binding-like beta-propeller repeat protein [Pirellulaceae bacterium]